MAQAPQRITPSPHALELLSEIQDFCGLPNLQAALDLLTKLKAPQLLAQLEIASSTDPATFGNLATVEAETESPLQRSPATSSAAIPELEEPPSLDSIL